LAGAKAAGDCTRSSLCNREVGVDYALTSYQWYSRVIALCIWPWLAHGPLVIHLERKLFAALLCGCDNVFKVVFALAGNVCQFAAWVVWWNQYAVSQQRRLFNRAQNRTWTYLIALLNAGLECVFLFHVDRACYNAPADESARLGSDFIKWPLDPVIDPADDARTQKNRKRLTGADHRLAWL